MSEQEPQDYPDGSVGRYVRERWAAVPAATTPRRRGGARLPARRPKPENEPAPPAVPEPGRELTPENLIWGAGPVRSDAADLESEIEPTTPPSGIEQVAFQEAARGTAPEPTAEQPASGSTPRRAAAAPGAGLRPPRRIAARPPAVAPDVSPSAAVAPDVSPSAAVAPAASPSPAAATTAAAPSSAAIPLRGVGPGSGLAGAAAGETPRIRTGETGPIGAADLSSARLLRPTRRPPQSGWRRLLYRLSGQLINLGEGPADIRRRELTARVNRPLLGCYKIATLSLKGGVGKTTVTATLGAMFASLRGDRVVAVDANPDRGTLSQKIPLETSATVRHLLHDAQRVRRYTDVRAYTSQGPSRLEVLASEQDPAVSEAFSEDDYRRTVNLLEHFYNIVLTDCGTGLMHSAMYGVLGVGDQLVIVSSGSIDGARSASATMDWLDAHGHGELVTNAVAVINSVHRSAGGVDLDRVAEHFALRCRAVVRIPFDAHLEEGAEVDLDRLEPHTKLALLELAAAVADGFPS